MTPQSVQRCLESRFGAMLPKTEAAMMHLARALPGEELGTRVYWLYEAFRPQMPVAVAGWGAAGFLDLERIGRLTENVPGGAKPAGDT